MWLLFACDDNYAMALAVGLYTTLERVPLDVPVRVVLIANDLSDVNKARLLRVVARARAGADIDWVDGGQLGISVFAGARHVTGSTYSRLFVGELFPSNVERVLYLDADVLVRRNLSQLFALDLESKTLGAARDVVIADLNHPYSGISDWANRQLQGEQPYFNAGVLLIDLKRWRANDSGPLTLKYSTEHNGLGNFDQDALNAVLHDDWRELDLEWNLQSALLLLHEHPSHSWVIEMGRRRVELLARASIVHFSGTIKPWHPSSVHPYAPEWRRKLMASGWFTPFQALKWRAGFFTRRAAFMVLVASGVRKKRERAD